MNRPRTFEQLVHYFKQRDLAANVEPRRRLEYPYYAGLPYPTWPLSWELVAEDGGWSVVRYDEYSVSHLIRAGSEADAVERLLFEVAQWVVTNDDVRRANTAWEQQCVEERRRQDGLQRGLYVLQLPNDSTSHNLL